ncbi:MAG: CinA family nicotinamide mononucleotide deamidase-related protein [Leptospirales bacterium]|nr:CinA family nicotinamide mononucleotide deamidase-related protein [Leptospirales bacterium]
MAFYIFSTGTELSSGRSRDTNGPDIARALSEAGLEVAAITLLPDDPEAILSELNRIKALPDAQGIIMTGGLGPTADDFTVDVLARFTGKNITEDEYAMRKLEIAAKRSARIKLESARRQARVLEDCHVLRNEKGMAPGMITMVEGTNTLLVAAMPGVPSEMKAMFENELFPEIKRRFIAHDRSRLVFLIYGVGESQVQATLFGDDTQAGLVTDLPSDFRWGVTAQAGFIKLFFESSDKALLEKINALATQAYPGIKLDKPVEEKLHDLCIERQFKLGLAESCTGGLIARIITDRPGSSQYFQGSCVVYANQAKTKLLGVTDDLLAAHGAVSEESAIAMANGALNALGADISLSITGIAGPDGGTKDKPVGTVYCAAMQRGREAQAVKWFMPFDRERIREYSGRMALLHLYNYLVSGI